MQRPSYFLIVLGAVALFAGIAAARLMPSSGAASPFETRVRAYLMTHPEVALDALARLEAREAAPETPPAAATDTAAIIRRMLSDVPPNQVAGNPYGDVTVVLFFDYRCPYCKASLAQEKLFLAAHPDARIVYRDLAILGEPSALAARAALASTRQRKYLPFHDALMAFRGDFTETDVFGLAMQLGLDIERLKADMLEPDITATLNANLAFARALNVEGTPAYIVGDHVLSGIASAEELAVLADDVRARGKQVGAAR